jgi:endonuclease/exonuclease/phosphatase family metal-dependent hydrolase
MTSLSRLRRLFLLLAILISLAGCAGAFASPAVLVAGHTDDALNRLQEYLPPMVNYTDPHPSPSTGEYAAPETKPAADWTVVTYNLRLGEAIDETIAAFRTVEPLIAADVVLMQEMDAAGVDTLARALGYNHVYFPASVAEDGDDFGNAILARGAIRDPAKLTLPGLHPLTGQQRTATRATIELAGVEALVYSTHIEVATAPPSLRAAQVAAIIEDVPEEATRVIVGGDFNTVTGRGVAALAEQFAAGGLTQATAELGPTYTRFGLRPSATDHVFARGFTGLEAGVLHEIEASDHFPVWVRFAQP